MKAVGRILGAVAVIALLAGPAWAQKGPAKYGEADKPRRLRKSRPRRRPSGPTGGHSATYRNNRRRTPGEPCAATARRRKQPPRRRRPSRRPNPPRAPQSNRKTLPGTVPDNDVRRAASPVFGPEVRFPDGGCARRAARADNPTSSIPRWNALGRSGTSAQPRPARQARSPATDLNRLRRQNSVSVRIRPPARGTI